MSDPEADCTNSEKYIQDLQPEEYLSDKKSKMKRFEIANKDEPLRGEEKKNDVTEEGSYHDDNEGKRKKIKRDKRELRKPDDISKEIKILAGSPGETSFSIRNTETPETMSPFQKSTPIAIVSENDNPFGVQGNSITPISMLDKPLDQHRLEPSTSENGTKFPQPLSEGGPNSGKDKAEENTKIPDTVIKEADKGKEEAKTKIPEKDSADIVLIEGEKKNKKTGLETGAPEEGKKPAPKISGIAPGAVRNLGSGSFKGSSVPLLLSMPAGGGGLSLLSAGLPPGRYVILPSTTSTVPSISSIPVTSSPMGIKTTMMTTALTQPSKTISLASLSTITTTTSAITSSPSVLTPPVLSGRVVRAATRGTYCGGKSVRGRRKSYTAAEKLAMIEAVESGQKKSNVADLFGVAPSTLACILLQKNKIRSDQMKVDLSRRRLRQSRQTPIVPAPHTRSSSATEGETEGNNDNPFVHFLSGLSPARPPVLEDSPEEIISMPDLSDRMGMEGSPTPTKLEGSSNYLTCSPLLSTMPGIQEDLLSTGAGPSSSSQEPMDENVPGSEFDQEEIDVKAEPVFNVAPEICDDENSQNNTQSSSDRPSSQSSPTSGMTGPYLLKKETHCATILDQLLRDDTFSDVTLTAEGQSIRAHKIVLCLASAYFRQVLSKESSVQNVIVFRDIKFSELRNLINFIYTGEATVDAAELESFMRTAEMLEVNSLCEGQRNFPKNLFPRGKEPEPEKPRPPTTTSKRSHNATTPCSPPTKSRKMMVESSPPMKLPKLSSGPSTSSEGATSSVPTSTTMIKSEPPGDDVTVEEDFHSRGDNDGGAYDSPVKSPSQYEDHDKSPPLDTKNESPEKSPPGRCPFCPSSHQPPRIGLSLTKHVHVCHPDKAAFPCDNCSRVFLKKSSFDAHIDDCIR